MRTTITRTASIEATSRLLQGYRMFDLEPLTELSQSWEVEMDLPAAWGVGAIVGPSMRGKTTIARWLAGAIGGRMIDAKDAEGRGGYPHYLRAASNAAKNFDEMAQRPQRHG